MRAEAVRRLAATDNQQLLAELARGDADPQVRRAAVRKVAEPAVVVELARGDEDGGVREAAQDALLDMALGGDVAAASTAAAALDHPRHLAALARDAALPQVRADAVRRLGNERSLVTLARTATDADVRKEAVARVSGEAPLLEIALKSEHKDAALAAAERLADRESLESVAGRARNKAAAKRARAIVGTRWPAVVVEAPPAPSAALPAASEEGAADEDAARYDDLLARQAEEARDHAARVASRVALCETVDAMAPGEEPARLAEIEEAWAALPPLEGVESESLQRRFAAALEGWRTRRAGWDEGAARRARMEAACADLEAIADLPDAAEADRRYADARKGWTGLQSMDGVEAGLQERYARAVARIEARHQETRQAATRRDEQSRARAQALCEQAERLARDPSPPLKECERVLRDARAALDDPASAGKRDRDALLSRLRAARASLYTKVQELRETEDWKRWANVGIQEDLCKEAEALVQENDLPRAARLLRELDERWKQASQVPKAQGDALWQRFRAARSQVRARCAVHFAEMRAARAENVRKKEALITEAESLAESTDWARTAERLRAMQGEWRATGPVSRAKSDEMWARFRAAGGRFFTRQKEDRVRRRAERAKNLERKQALCAEAEALAEATDWDRAAAEMKRIQAEWRAAGAVPRDRSDALSLRFRQAADGFLERYKNREALDTAARVAEREALCATLEELAAHGDEATVAERLRASQAAWKAARPLAGPRGAALDARYAAAVESIVGSWPGAFKDSDLDAAANRARLEALCVTVEGIAPAESKPGAAAASPAALLAERWREALAANTMGARGDESSVKRERKDKVEAARAAWSRVGPVGSSDRQRLDERFREACRRALGE